MTVNAKLLVSVGLPVRNGERFIRGALDSLLSQTYRNLEIVISDNASTDGTEVICREYAAKDPRIRYHRSPDNVGMLPNFWRVFELSSGELFTWVAADDVRPLTSIEPLVEALRANPRAVMAHGSILLKGDGRQDVVEISNESLITSSDAAARVRAFTRGIRHNAMFYGLYRRDVVARATLGRGWGPDYLFCLQIAFLGPLQYVPGPMIVYRERVPVPRDNPMYAEVPITVTDLLTLGRRKVRRSKCWRMLFMGCYYVGTRSDTRLGTRVRGMAAYVSSFTGSYRRRLAKELLFQVFTPAAWLVLFGWRVASQWPYSLRLARKLQATLSRI